MRSKSRTSLWRVKVLYKTCDTYISDWIYRLNKLTDNPFVVPLVIRTGRQLDASDDEKTSYNDAAGILFSAEARTVANQHFSQSQFQYLQWTSDYVHNVVELRTCVRACECMQSGDGWYKRIKSIHDWYWNSRETVDEAQLIGVANADDFGIVCSTKVVSRRNQPGGRGLWHGVYRHCIAVSVVITPRGRTRCYKINATKLLTLFSSNTASQRTNVSGRVNSNFYAVCNPDEF